MGNEARDAYTGDLGHGGPSGYCSRFHLGFQKVAGPYGASGVRVASRASFDDKERIRQAVDIVDLVGSYLQLRREGRGYKALCPWHDDSRPSLQVNPERQSFKCWVCDIGGDIFSFIMKMEKIDFPEALTMLAERAGITLTPQHAGGPVAGSKPAGGPDDKRHVIRGGRVGRARVSPVLA